jgi:hypothetical protein
MSERRKNKQPRKTFIHPAVEAFNRYRDANPSTFAGTADGRYLQNRLEYAFQAGWEAYARAVKDATEGRADGD